MRIRGLVIGVTPLPSPRKAEGDLKGEAGRPRPEEGIGQKLRKWEFWLIL